MICMELLTRFTPQSSKTATRTVSPTSQEENFTNWRFQQTKPDGFHYSNTAIYGTVFALRNATKKLIGVNISPTNLFLYTNLRDFDAVYQIIITASNYEEVKRSSGSEPKESYSRGSYSTGLNHYKRFLEERALL